MRKQARRNLLAALLLLAGISWTRTRPQIPMESSAPPTPAVTLTPSPESWRRVDNQCFEFTWSCEIPDSLLWESDVMGASGTYRPNSGFVVHKYPVAGPLTEELLVRRQHNEESYRDTQPVTGRSGDIEWAYQIAPYHEQRWIEGLARSGRHTVLLMGMELTATQEQHFLRTLKSIRFGPEPGLKSSVNP